VRALIVLLLVLWLAAPARADEARPLYIEGRAISAQQLAFTWRIPPGFDRRIAPDLHLPTDCTQEEGRRSWSDGLGHWNSARWNCEKPLGTRPITIRYPDGNPNLATIFKAHPLGVDQPTVGVFLPQVAEFAFPAPGEVTSERGMLLDYLVLGMEHIWIGLDHLLFVACLIWIAGSIPRILATITGFTLAHSVTLALAALDLVAVPVRTIEVLIALSIVLLAVELARGERETLTWRYPITVSIGFGLLHGFGFAAVLGEIGLPQDGLVSALFAFNLGIEIGQLLFALALILLTRLVALAVEWARGEAQFSRRLAALPAGPRLIIAYVVGTTASFWMLDRMA